MVSATVKEKSNLAKFKIYIICGILAYLYLFLVALHYIAIRDIEKRISMNDAIDVAFINVFTNPLEIIGHVSLNNIGSILGFTILGFGLAGMAYSTYSLKKHDNSDTVNGEAHWMTLKEYKEYCKKRTSPFGKEDINGFDNVIYSKEMRLSMNGFKSKRNTNTLAIGGSGAGKSRFFVGPNLLCGNSSFLCTDPSGELYRDYAQVLADMGYKIKVFNLTNVYEGSQYNPFHYIKEEADVFIIANTIMENTTPPDQKGGDPFWPKAEMLLISALMLYLWHTQPEEEQTFANLLFLISCAEVDENDSSKRSVLDQMFLNLEKDDPDNLAVAQYKGFKLGAGKTLKSILISVKARLQIFELSDIRYLTCKDTMEFDTFSDTRQALFVIIPTADDTFNFIVSMMYTQFFMTLYKYCETRAPYGYCAYINNHIVIKTEQAKTKKDSDDAKIRLEKYVAEIKKGVSIQFDKEKNVYNVYTQTTHELIGWRGSKKLLNSFLKDLSHIEIEQVGLMGCPNHVRMICDEFSNISTIPNLEKRLATMRKYNISMDIILQAISQLKKMYKDEWNTIAGNCDVKLFLGSSDNETIKWLCEITGKKTTRVQNLNFNGKQGASESVNLSSRELITPDLLSLMKDDECLVLVRSERPYYGKKYDIVDHPMYDYAQTRKAMYKVKNSIDPELIDSNVPFRMRNKLKKGLEDFDKRKAELRNKKFKTQNSVSKNASADAKKNLEKVQEDIEKKKKKRQQAEEAAFEQQIDNMTAMMGEAIYGKKNAKVTSEEIVNMGETGIQEVIESKIFIEQYPLDEWTYLTV